MTHLLEDAGCDVDPFFTSTRSNEIIMSPIRLAKWKLAVLTELAENGEIMAISVEKGNAPADFRATSVSAAAAGFVGAFADTIVGASLENVLDAGCEWEQIRSACAQVTATGIDALRISMRCSEIRGAMVLLQISRTVTGLSFVLSCPEAQTNRLDAQGTLHALLEAEDAHDGAHHGDRNFRLPALLRPPVRAQANPPRPVERRTQEEWA